MMKEYLAWIIFTFAAVSCLFWIGFGVRDDLREDDVFHNIVEERLELAKAPGDTIIIGMAGDFTTHKSLLLGAQLAAQEINANGGILGKKVTLEVGDDQGTIEDSLTVAQKFASNPKIGFVIGHTNLGLSNGVAQNYEFYGVLRLSPNTSDSTKTGFSLLFENGIKPRQIGESVLSIAAKNNWHKLGIIYSKNKQAMQQARQFESMANKQNINVPLAFAFEGRGSGISTHMVKWKRELALDAMVLSIDQADIPAIISACRAVGINCPFILLEGQTRLSPDRKDDFGTVYSMTPPRTDAAYIRLAVHFQKTFNLPLTMDAILGFDALHILAQAITKADSFVPSEVAETLKNSPLKNSISGTTQFDAHGAAIRNPPKFSIL